MKIKNVKRTITIAIAKEFDLNILEATLLTIDEAIKLPMRLRKYNGWWWLKSRGRGFDLVACVNRDSFINDNYGADVGNPYGKVRPALVISNLEFSNLKIGDTFKFGDKDFEIISNNLALCLDDIGTCAFREDWESPDANIYEKSDIKKYVDEWFEKSIEKSIRESN